MTDFHILIPARLNSTRLPEKALADVAGLPLVVRVWQRAQQCKRVQVAVVTDDQRIAEVITQQGGQVVMSSPSHQSGTDRISEAVEVLGLENKAIVVNLQGDEPLMPIACIQQVADLLLQDSSAQMATLYDDCSEEQWLDPDVVKLIVSNQKKALTFSRAPIPHQRGGGWPGSVVKRHVGLYAYRASALREWVSLPASRIEQVEHLEQWRALSAGWSIACDHAVEIIPAGVDHIDDLRRVCDAVEAATKALD